MNGLAVLLFSLVMYGWPLWFLRILKKDSHEDSRHFTEVSQIAIVFLGMAIPIVVVMLQQQHLRANPVERSQQHVASSSCSGGTYGRPSEA
jgi:hypothetical protein